MCRLTPLCVILLTAVVWSAIGSVADAQPKKSEENVKFTVKAEKPADGKQVVTLTMKVADGWHAYANPVGNKDFADIQTTVTFMAGGKPVPAKVDYPTGTLKKDAVVGDYNIYEGTVTIKAVLNRAGVTGPVEAAVKVETCNERTCLLPSTVKVKVD